MDFIDLFDDWPSIKGIYDVKIINIDKGGRISKAFWDDQTFTPINDKLKDQEFIFSWRNNDIILKSSVLLVCLTI